MILASQDKGSGTLSKQVHYGLVASIASILWDELPSMLFRTQPPLMKQYGAIEAKQTRFAELPGKEQSLFNR